MSSTPPSPPEPNRHSRGGQFLTTRWSIVLAAADSDDTSALEQLLRGYWYPLYAFVRRSGRSVEDAQDLTQAFLLHTLERDVIAKADREFGRFRSYLLGSLKNFLANDHRKASAQKRGGGTTIVSIDDEHGEERYMGEANHDLTPADHFERSWALALLDRVFARLRAEFDNAGRLPLFEALEPQLTGAKDGQPYAVIAKEFGITEGTVGVTVHRLRHRYGELLREEIADTVAEPEEVDDELNFLMTVVASR